MYICQTCLTLVPLETQECPKCTPPASGSSADETDPLNRLKTVLINPEDNNRTPIAPSGATPLIGRNREFTAQRYSMFQQLGAGAMGRVYRAWDHKLEKYVALKYLHPTHLKSPRLVELFHNEVSTAQELTHLNLCRVYDIGEHGGRHYFSMEYVTGQALDSYLRRKGRLDTAETLEIASQVCEGLEVLHQKSVLHRDLKPANVIVGDDGRVKITDFGLADFIANISSDSIVGTVPYIAPEILELKTATPSSDIFSLGVMLYEVSTGQRPYQINSAISLRKSLHRMELLTRLKAGPVPPDRMLGDYDPELSEFIMHCLRPAPEERPESVDKLSSAIAIILRKGRVRRNPYICDCAVRGGDFLGKERQDLADDVIGRLDTGQSTVLVGELKSGKTSFLLKLADQIKVEDNMEFLWLDLHTKPRDYSPVDFWKDSLEALEQNPGNDDLVEALRAAAESNYREARLRHLFATLHVNGKRLVLLLDEFDKLLGHRNFPLEFFAQLRSLATTTNGLAIVPASRYSMKQLNEISPRSQRGSDYFNNFGKEQLLPFENETVQGLLGHARGYFSQRDKRLVRALAGRQPYLLQAMARTLFEAKGKNRWQKAAPKFYDKAAVYFDQLWEGWTNNYRTIAFFVCLAEWASRAVGENLAHDEIVRRKRFKPGLDELKRVGLVEFIDGEIHGHMRHSVEWEGKEWVLGAEAFAWWMWEVAVVGSRTITSYEDWAGGEDHNHILSRGEWSDLLNAAKQGQRWQTRDLSHMTEEFLESVAAESST